MTPTTNDKKFNVMLWIVGIAFGAMLGIGGTVTLSYGATKNQVEVNTVRLDRLEKTSVNYIYVEEIIKSNYLLIDILKAAPGSKEMEDALRAWRDFQVGAATRMNPSRGGNAMTPTAE